MVIEKDDGSPSRDQIIGAAKSGVATVAAIYEENWGEAVEEGVGFIYDVSTIFQQIAAGGDDIYPPYVLYFDYQTLLSLTSGKKRAILERFFDQSVGNYDHVSIRRADSYTDPWSNRGLQWSVYYIIQRTE